MCVAAGKIMNCSPVGATGQPLIMNQWVQITIFSQLIDNSPPPQKKQNNPTKNKREQRAQPVTPIWGAQRKFVPITMIPSLATPLTPSITHSDAETVHSCQQQYTPDTQTCIHTSPYTHIRIFTTHHTRMHTQ